MTEGEVCPNEVGSDRNRVPKAVRRSKALPSGWECSSWFHAGACSATIGAEFGTYLGNVGQILLGELLPLHDLGGGHAIREAREVSFRDHVTLPRGQGDPGRGDNQIFLDPPTIAI